MDDDTAAETLPVLSYPELAQPGDVAVYQFATASAMAPWLAGRPEALVVNYHNVTPPELMAPWDNHLALGQLRAQGDLRLLAPRTSLAVADSGYNEAHLAAAGFAVTAVISPSAALQTTAQAAPPPRRPRRGAAAARGALVGRRACLAQQGAREHHRGARRRPRPRRPGRDAAAHRQAGDRFLCRRVAPLCRRARPGRRGAVCRPCQRCHRRAAYAGADVLVVTSEHEGFCVPVVEAMAAGVPVVAFDQGAVPEVLGGAGVLVSDKDPYVLAAAIAALLHDVPRRDAVIAAGRQRLATLDLGLGRRPLRRPAGPPGRARLHLVVSGIHQFVPMLHRADAVGRHTLRLRDVTGGARHPVADLRGDGRSRHGSPRPVPLPSYADEAAAGDLLVYQFATASGIGPWLGARAEPLVVNYHNVTPPEYYAPWDNGMARHQLLAQTQLRELAPRAALGLAVSAFNEVELREAGFRRTAVVPPAAIVPAGPATAPPTARRCTADAGCPLGQCRASRAEQGDRVRRHGAAGHPGP